MGCWSSVGYLSSTIAYWERDSCDTHHTYTTKGQCMELLIVSPTYNLYARQLFGAPCIDLSSCTCTCACVTIISLNKLHTVCPELIKEKKKKIDISILTHYNRGEIASLRIQVIFLTVVIVMIWPVVSARQVKCPVFASILGVDDNYTLLPYM